jgi:hypothetical protein
VLYDPTRSWWASGACQWADPTPFFANNGQLDRAPAAHVQAQWDSAKEVCARCPVLAECRRDTLGEEYGVWGGLDEYQRYMTRKKFAENKRWKKWPEELRLEWGEHLAKLRARGHNPFEIRRKTGLLMSVVDALIQEWEASKKAPKAAPARPEPKALPPIPFPEKNGERHGWVRNGRRMVDGWYAGHTSDGVWVRMHIRAGRGYTYKFFRAADVQFYNPQRRYVVPYYGRPDADSVQEDAHAA